MKLEIIGAGFGRTGTMSLQKAIEQLGFGPCYHMAEVFANPDHIPLWRSAADGAIDWSGLFENYRSTVDWPGCTFWRELLEQNPDAKVLLSTRDPESWHRSVGNTIYHTMTMDVPDGMPESFVEVQAFAREHVIEQCFGGRILEAAHAIDVYETHYAAVREGVPKDQLIEYPVGSGWGPLCEALGVAVPDAEFPRVNTTGEYRERIGLEPVEAS